MRTGACSRRGDSVLAGGRQMADSASANYTRLTLRVLTAADLGWPVSLFRPKGFVAEFFFMELLQENPLVLNVQAMFVHEHCMYGIMEYCPNGTMQEFLDNLKKKVSVERLDMTSIL